MAPALGLFPLPTKPYLSGPNPPASPQRWLKQKEPVPNPDYWAPSSPWAGSISKNEGVEEAQIFGLRTPSVTASQSQAQCQLPTLGAGGSPLPGVSAPASWAAASFFHCSTSCSAF